MSEFKVGDKVKYEIAPGSSYSARFKPDGVDLGATGEYVEMVVFKILPNFLLLQDPDSWMYYGNLDWKTKYEHGVTVSFFECVSKDHVMKLS